MTQPDIQVHRAEQLDQTFTISDSGGTTIDLTASQIDNVHLDVAPEYSHDTKTIEVTADTVNSSGDAQFILDSNETDHSEGLYEYEVWIEYDGSENYTAEVGQFYIRPRVDR